MLRAAKLHFEVIFRQVFAFLGDLNPFVHLANHLAQKTKRTIPELKYKTANIDDFSRLQFES